MSNDVIERPSHKSATWFRHFFCLKENDSVYRPSTINYQLSTISLKRKGYFYRLRTRKHSTFFRFFLIPFDRTSLLLQHAPNTRQTRAKHPPNNSNSSSITRLTRTLLCSYNCNYNYNYNYNYTNNNNRRLSTTFFCPFLNNQSFQSFQCQQSFQCLVVDKKQSKFSEM